MDIKSFLDYYRKTFPSATITPKLHLLEDHVVPWVQRWGVGAGLMGEQGAESIHSHINKLEGMYRTIPNHLKRLEYLVKEYNLETAPSLNSLRPPIKKRKLEKRD